MFQIKVTKVLSGPAPDSCQVLASHKMDLKEISGSASKPSIQKDDNQAKEKLKQAELQVGTV